MASVRTEEEGAGAGAGVTRATSVEGCGDIEGTTGSAGFAAVSTPWRVGTEGGGVFGGGAFSVLGAGIGAVATTGGFVAGNGSGGGSGKAFAGSEADEGVEGSVDVEAREDVEPGGRSGAGGLEGAGALDSLACCIGAGDTTLGAATCCGATTGPRRQNVVARAAMSTMAKAATQGRRERLPSDGPANRHHGRAAISSSASASSGSTAPMASPATFRIALRIRQSGATF